MFLPLRLTAKRKEKRVNCESGLSGEKGQSIVWKYTKVIFWWRLINCLLLVLLLLIVVVLIYKIYKMYKSDFLVTCHKLSSKMGRQLPTKSHGRENHALLQFTQFHLGKILHRQENINWKRWLYPGWAKQKKVIYGFQFNRHEHNYFQSEPQW